MRNAPIHAVTLGLAFALLICGSLAATRAQDPPGDLNSQQVDREIAGLIGQLGAEEFDSREVAQAKLERFGARAFDALLEAQSSDNLEVATRAKFLVRGLQVRWADESDPIDVRSTLRNYGESGRVDRKSLLERLASLDEGKGAAALARLARFETDPVLAKTAALLVMHLGKDLSPEGRERLAQSIKNVTGQSRRDTAQWLRTYARSLNEPETAVAEWNRLCDAEFLNYMRQPGDESIRQTLRDLLRWQAEMLLGLKRDDEALAIDNKLAGLVDIEGTDVLDHTDWLVKTRQWQVIVDTLGKFESIVKEQPLLMYRLAEATKSLGDEKKGAEIARQALELKPEELTLHESAAMELARRGLFEWAESEYRELIKRVQANPDGELTLCSRLAEMLHDQLKEKEAGEALKQWFDRHAANPNLPRLLDEDYAARKSRMHYFFARDHREKGDFKEEARELETAIQTNERDIDVLIALYRLNDATEARKKETQRQIEQAASVYRERIGEFSEALADARRIPGFEQRVSQLSHGLAFNCNQFAWLVSNTEGEKHEALTLSKRSLELRPNEAAYLDTLGRCYFAVGDFDNAIRFQKEALKADPHSGLMRRQLKVFEDAKAKPQ